MRDLNDCTIANFENLSMQVNKYFEPVESISMWRISPLYVAIGVYAVI